MVALSSSTSNLKQFLLMPNVVSLRIHIMPQVNDNLAWLDPNLHFTLLNSGSGGKEWQAQAGWAMHLDTFYGDITMYVVWCNSCDFGTISWLPIKIAQKTESTDTNTRICIYSCPIIKCRP